MSVLQVAASRLPLMDHVYNIVKDQLLEGRYREDRRILVEEIAASLGVSRQPVMGAMKRLAIEGLVTIIPQVGCQARRTTVSEAIDFYRLFAEGESLLARLAAERAVAADMSKLKIISAQIGELRSRTFEPGEIGRLYRPLNNQFHAEIHRIAKSPLIAQTLAMQRDFSDYFVAQSNRPIFGERLQQAHDEHEDIIKALANPNSESAGAIMRDHVLAITLRLQIQAITSPA